jgi:dephospho-CoA kinase
VNASGSRPRESRRTFVAALTGGIASGKGAAADCFSRKGVAVFDADAVARELVQPGMPALAEMAAAFGTNMLTVSGELDRRCMRDLVFSDAVARRKLEAILHPRVRAALREAAAHCAAPYCVLAIPLLAEVRKEYEFVDRVLVVDASPSVQRRRLIQRDHGTPEAAAAVIATQASREQRLAIADDVIDNDGSRDALDPVVGRLHVLYQRLAASRPVRL